MMVFTHILLGIVLAALATISLSVNPNVLVVAGVFGGAFPDADMLLMHRKTLHFPVGYSIASFCAVVIYLVSGSAIMLALLIGVTAAALHCLMDILGGGKEMRPWRKTDNRAVYNHVSGRWIHPLRIFYDGSVPDLLLAVLLTIIAGWLLPREFWPILIVLVLLSVFYTLFRRIVTQLIPEEYTTFSSYIQKQVRENLR